MESSIIIKDWRKLIFETTITENKNAYCAKVPNIVGVTKVTLKKILYKIELPKPTGFRVYQSESGTSFYWVFGEVQQSTSYFNKREAIEIAKHFQK